MSPVVWKRMRSLAEDPLNTKNSWAPTAVPVDTSAKMVLL